MNEKTAIVTGKFPGARQGPLAFSICHLPFALQPQAPWQCDVDGSLVHIRTDQNRAMSDDKWKMENDGRLEKIWRFSRSHPQFDPKGETAYAKIRTL